MKALAAIQLTVSIIAAITLALPSTVFLVSPLGVLRVLFVWGVGLYLMLKYYKISSGAIPERRSFGVWLLSLLFNLPGLLAALWLIPSALSRASSGNGDALFLFFLPSIAGTILSTIGCSRAKKLVDVSPEAQQVS